jgi:hypothetical protein
LKFLTPARKILRATLSAAAISLGSACQLSNLDFLRQILAFLRI